MAMKRRLWRRMGGSVLGCFAACVGAGAGAGCSCLCARALEEVVEERKALVSGSSQVVRLTDLLVVKGSSSSTTLGFHLQPKTVELRVSMHCYGCAKKVHKHISKMEGVTWFEVDLERKKVVVTGDVTPLEVLQSVSKVKLAQLWMPPQPC
ncbi:hypothetical protein ZWY2020_044733 [Hordeum vulgare]|nr:hypothetical protein ZWY2020_044733 [Hordeum vulgare]